MPRKFWTGDDGKQIPIEDMSLGHLCNTIRYMGERLEEARAAGEGQQIARIESYLGDLLAAQEQRLPEIEKAQGLLGVLLKSARK